MRLKAKEIYAMYDAITALSKEKTAMPTAFYIAKNTKVIKVKKIKESTDACP